VTSSYWEEIVFIPNPDGEGGSQELVRHESANCTISAVSLRDRKEGAIAAENGRSLDSVTWSPDSQWIAFASSQGLTVAHPDGTGKSVVSADNWQPVNWSADSKEVLCLKDGRLYSVSVNGGSSRPISLPHSFQRSPDNLHMLYQSASKAVWVANADGSGARQIATPSSSLSMLRWYDNDHVQYAVRTGNTQEGWLIDADGKNAEKVIEGVGSFFLSPVIPPSQLPKSVAMQNRTALPFHAPSIQSRSTGILQSSPIRRLQKR
jgi:Tol biopolymer transport system component